MQIILQAFSRASCCAFSSDESARKGVSLPSSIAHKLQVLLFSKGINLEKLSGEVLVEGAEL